MRSRRLERSRLLERVPAERLVDAVSEVCGIHAQVMPAAEWSIGARVDGVTQEDVRRELWERRSLVKTWSLRGTLHLHPASELPLWMAARRGALGYPYGAWHDADVEPEQAAAALEAITAALDGRRLLREELADEVGARLGPWAREKLSSGWGYLLGPACFTGRLCHGPPQGAKVTFVRADQWIGGWEDVDENEALAEVLRRYLAAYGPARPADFAEWVAAKSFQVAGARRVFDALAGELEEVDVEGHRAWVLAGDGAFGAPVAGSVRLLPQYDVYVMGFREREHFVPAAARERLAEHPRGRFEGPAAVAWLLLDGVASGWWTRQLRGKRVEVRVEPFVRLRAAQRRRLEEEVARLGRFLRAEPELVIA